MEDLCVLSVVYDLLARHFCFFLFILGGRNLGFCVFEMNGDNAGSIGVVELAERRERT